MSVPLSMYGSMLCIRVTVLNSLRLRHGFVLRPSFCCCYCCLFVCLMLSTSVCISCKSSTIRTSV